ncbi:hypothetical protein D9619_005859 [Psilocybe cf. subviscida]|uniref:WD40 repeat-like protein n=1 Tax=Psilocybe cf. subviscida TaxID=2480587 RepID=A0A8H5FB58_9AGAR|nr:hypothetical protein D9619_005859 [Psilocybe cf. subviscida]
MPSASSSSKNQPSRHDMSVILVTGSYDHEIRFWEAWSGICSRTIPRESGQVNRLAISHDKRFLAAAIHKKLHIYDIASTSNEPLVVFEGHSNNITCIAFNIEGKWIVSGGEDGTIKIWDLRNPAAPARVYENSCGVNDIAIHPNQGELITCDQGGSIKQWDLSDNICSHELTPAGDVPMRSISLATDGSCLVAGNNKASLIIIFALLLLTSDNPT